METRALASLWYHGDTVSYSTVSDMCPNLACRSSVAFPWLLAQWTRSMVTTQPLLQTTQPPPQRPFIHTSQTNRPRCTCTHSVLGQHVATLCDVPVLVENVATPPKVTIGATCTTLIFILPLRDTSGAIVLQESMTDTTRIIIQVGRIHSHGVPTERGSQYHSTQRHAVMQHEQQLGTSQSTMAINDSLLYTIIYLIG